MSSNNSVIQFTNRGSDVMARIDLIMGAVRQMHEWNPGMESMMERVINKMSLYACTVEFARHMIETIVRERGLLTAMDTALSGDAE